MQNRRKAGTQEIGKKIGKTIEKIDKNGKKTIGKYLCLVFSNFPNFLDFYISVDGQAFCNNGIIQIDVVVVRCKGANQDPPA